MSICKRCGGTGDEPDQLATGQTLRGMRTSAGISLRRMAKLIGLSHSFLSQLESGQRSWRRSVQKRYEQVIQQNTNQI
jgi:predicted transcriptional regulator